MMYQKHLVTGLNVYLEGEKLYADFSYRRSQLNDSGEVCEGPLEELKRVYIESRVKDVEVVPPRRPATMTQRIFQVIRPRPYILILHTEDGVKYLPLTDEFATKCLFESRGLDNMWVVEHPTNIQFTSTSS